MNKIHFDYTSIISQTDEYIKMLEMLDKHCPVFTDYIMDMKNLKIRIDEVREKLPDLFTY